MAIKLSQALTMSSEDFSAFIFENNAKLKQAYVNHKSFYEKH